jgi:excisionase family DNA binding protein
MPRPAAALTYTIPEAAEALRISSRSVRRRIAEGTLPTVRIGGRLLVPRRALEDWLDRTTRQAS